MTGQSYKMRLACCFVLFFGVFFWVQGDPQPVRETNGYVTLRANAIKVPLPSVRQPDGYTCGVACLMSILGHYGAGPDEYEVLRDELGVTEEGADYRRMAEYARKLGFRVNIEANMSLPQLLQELDHARPVICSIQAYDEGANPAERTKVYKGTDVNGHYVVAIGYDSRNVYFMDPSLVGRRAYLSHAEFEERWHDNEGTAEKPQLIHHLGMAIWKEGEQTMRARRIE